MMARARDGRFVADARLAGGLADAVAAAIYAGYFAGVCRQTGLDHDAAVRHLARPHSPALNNDLGWRRAAYARQLAMYLTATEADVPQAQLGRITGLADAGVHKALRAIEDLRDGDAGYEELITCVLVDVAMTEPARARAGVGRARRLRKEGA